MFCMEIFVFFLYKFLLDVLVSFFMDSLEIVLFNKIVYLRNSCGILRIFFNVFF